MTVTVQYKLGDQTHEISGTHEDLESLSLALLKTLRTRIPQWQRLLWWYRDASPEHQEKFFRSLGYTERAYVLRLLAPEFVQEHQEVQEQGTGEAATWVHSEQKQWNEGMKFDELGRPNGQREEDRGRIR